MMMNEISITWLCFYTLFGLGVSIAFREFEHDQSVWGMFVSFVFWPLLFGYLVTGVLLVYLHKYKVKDRNGE